ncbi:MAG TPA: hypothetical protein VFH54_06945 [Mycobacteriales bacterium]|nr:hypothetical protein [Mycobacteriales bacterium]
MTDAAFVARLQWIVVVAMWLLVAIRVLTTRRSAHDDRRLLAALEALRGLPQQRREDESRVSATSR